VERGGVLPYLWRLSRPEVWLVTIIPMHVGWLLASHELVPRFGRWAAFWARASQGGATSADFLATLAEWWGDARGWALMWTGLWIG